MRFLSSLLLSIACITACSAAQTVSDVDVGTSSSAEGSRAPAVLVNSIQDTNSTISYKPLPRYGGAKYCSAHSHTAAVANALSSDTPESLGFTPASYAGVIGYLPTVGEGQPCGSAVAVCGRGLCCGQTGFCSRDPVACDGTCQCAFSGYGSKCKGQFPIARPPLTALPIARPGGPCGRWLARCPQSQCCSEWGVCAADSSPHCRKAACQPDLSSPTSVCRYYNNQLAKRVRKFELTLTKGTVAPDGQKREAILINGFFSGPPLFAEVGDRLIVTVVNKMREDASVHFHGMLQRTSVAMDGVVAGTQRPIRPGESFIYNFIADSPGTFWYHSHYQTQYADGLWGPLIIRDPLTTTYDAEPILTLTDWHNETGQETTDTFITTGKVTSPQSILINGIGQFGGATSSTCGRAGRRCKYAKVKAVASSCDEPRTRLKLLHTGAAAGFNVSVDGYRMIVVAADGVSVDPAEVGSVYIDVGQRMDILLCTRETVNPSKPVWIRVGMVKAPNVPLSLPSKAILFFTEQPPTALPTTPEKYLPPRLTFYDWNDGEVDVNVNALMAQYGSSAPPPAPTKTITWTVNFNKINQQGTAGEYAFVNNVSLSMTPYAPSWLERYSNNPENLPPPNNADSGLGWQVVELQEGDVVDIIINNEDLGGHPFHLHGHWMWIMGWGPVVNPATPPAQPYRYNGKPLSPTTIRDTALVPNYSWAVFRFIADNPGLWIMHCHIDHHLGVGMGVLFKEGLQHI